MAKDGIVAVRSATIDDVEIIVELVEMFVKSGDLLPRSRAEIMMTVGNWVIASLNGMPVGIGSLLIYSPILAEVRSLAVREEAQGYGLGRAIVEDLLRVAKEKRIPTVFALTRAVPFFTRLGFEITDKERFPEKIWTACRICPIRDNCDETAVIYEIDIEDKEI